MNRRLWHVYIGCFFAPLLIYFSLSGAWQMFHLNDVPKDHPTAFRRALHQLSNPHRDALLPGRNGRTAKASLPFQVAACAMSFGFVLTALLGIQMGLQVPRRRAAIIGCLIAGTVVPMLFLFL